MSGWCATGEIKVGDFNFDGQSDALCVTVNNMYLLYGAQKSFVPASSSIDGNITSNIESLIQGWSNSQKIYAGDFDGDRYSDILRINTDSLDILYGDKNNIFISRVNDTLQGFNVTGVAASITSCYNADSHHIIIADVNGDGRSDIYCDTVPGTTIYSKVKPYTNPLKSLKIIVENITLLSPNYGQDIQRSSDINQQTHNNIIPGDQQSWSEANSFVQKNVVQSVYFPFDCLNMGIYTTEVDFVLSQYLQVNERVLWNYGDPTSIRSVYLEAYSQWINGNLVQYESIPIDFFSLTINTPTGSCLKHTLVNNYATLAITYNASATLYMYDQGQLVTGDTLEGLATEIVTSASLSNDAMSVTFPIQGHIIVNLLGVGDGQLDQC